jgi:opacity protein-like surface antigen
MNNFKMRFGLAVCVMVMGQAIGHADFVSGSQTIAVFGGESGSSTRYDFEPGSERRITGGGGSFGAQYLYYLKGTPAIAIGADLASSLNGNRRSGDMLAGFESTARLKSFVGMMIARLAFPRGPWRPYIFAGIGGHNSSQQLSAQPQAGVTWPGGGTENRMLIDEHKSSVAIGYGIGMDVFATESFFLGMELRAIWLGGLDTDDTAALRAAGFTEHSKEGSTQGNIFFRAGVKF